MNHSPFQQQAGDLRLSRAATLQSAKVMREWATKEGRDYSLINYISSRLPGAALSNRNGAEAVMRMGEVAQTTAGAKMADGVWVPFAALTRDLTTASAGALTAPTKNDLAASLAPVPSVLGNGCTILTGLTGSSVEIPGLDSPGVDVTAGWVAENAVAAGPNPTFGLRTITPKTLTVELIISRRLLNQTNDATEQALRRELMRRILNEIDRAIILGDGVNQPLGLLNDTAVEKLQVGTNGGPPTWAHVVELETAVTGRSGLLAEPAFIMHPSLRKKLRTTQRGTGLDYILTGSSLLDQPVFASALLPTNLTKGTGTSLTPLIFGDLSEIVVGFWGPAAIDLIAEPFSRATSGAVRLIARVEVGTVVSGAGAISAYRDINPA